MAATEETVPYDRMKELKEFDESKIGTKGLSDSGITTIPRFFIHPPETISDLKSSSTCPEIPLIDFSYVNSDHHRPNIVQKVHEAAKTWGFFQVINHGIPISVLNKTIASVKAFHEQPCELKAKHYVREERRGVMYTSNIDLYRSKSACWKDTLQVWLSPEPAKMDEIPEVCRREVVEWDMHGKKLAETLMELMSLGLGLEGGKFKELTFSDTRVFVCHYYPYCPQSDLTMGSKCHTDPGIFTVLLQNQVQGLQVKHGEEWVDVKPLPGGLIINIGDFLQVVSNGEYKSVQHRVLANSSKEPRISVVMFLNLGKWRESGYYGPLPELLTPNKPAIYRDFTMQEFHENFYGKVLDSKSLIQKITI